MALPYAERAYVDRKKVADYLLSQNHPVGRFKSRFFLAAGFEPERSGLLADGLRQIASTGSVERVLHSQFGTKYIVDGILESPAGIRVSVRTVWIVETGTDRPRFVTAFPQRPLRGS